MTRTIQYFFALAIVLTIIGCTNEPSGLLGEISKLEKEVEATPTVDVINKLTAKYDEYIVENPDSVEWNGRYLYRSAARKLQMNSISKAVTLLDRGVKEFSASSATPKTLLLLGELYKDKFVKPEYADWYYELLAKTYPNDENAATAKSKKSNPAITLDEIILNKKEELYLDSAKTRINQATIRQLINMYKQYATLLPDEPKTPDYLYETYELSNSIRLFQDAVVACETLSSKYPDHPRASTAMFLTGYLYENEMRDLDKAKAIYTDFITKFPKHEFADDAQFALDNLGKSPDEILKELQEKNKQNQGGAGGN